MMVDLDEIGKRIGKFKIQVKDNPNSEWKDQLISEMGTIYIGRQGAETDANSVKRSGKYFDVRIIQIIEKPLGKLVHKSDCKLQIVMECADGEICMGCNTKYPEPQPLTLKKQI